MVPPPDPFYQDFILGLTIFTAALAWNACVIWYSLRAKWWKNIYGINTWLVSFIISIALDRLCVLVLFPEVNGYTSTWIGIFTYVGLAVTGFQRTYLLEKAQREGEREGKQLQTLHQKATEHTD